MMPYRVSSLFQQSLLGTMDNYNPYFSSSPAYNIQNENLSKVELFDYSHPNNNNNNNNNNYWTTHNLLSNVSSTSSNLIPSATTTSSTLTNNQRPHQSIRTPPPCLTDKLNETHLSQTNTTNISALHHHTHLHQHLYSANNHRSSITDLDMNPNWNNLNGGSGDYHHMTTPSFRQYSTSSCLYPNNIYGEHQCPIKFEIEYNPRSTTSSAYSHVPTDQLRLPQDLQNICKSEQLLTTNLDSTSADIYTNGPCISQPQPHRQQKQQFEWLKSHHPQKQHVQNGKKTSKVNFLFQLRNVLFIY
ncbi:unnamed protein product [Didymodactylos carnosus]|uniref:Uncharacterized protein n=1 Tax=Didymodactylos carnosus TaxID=1234261 RepID=A0A814XAN4_9BILA|nr:unnamed protein product [Didymodactylos carnosus]CAF1614280.1 unnamed protein product [Didymodactylos carnosus]CAF3977611.1 unnamed protein product [Didymodactylos carnosus]CAF4429917.1 unnamed protein product [Didymodactylos carnosus]